MGKRMLKEAKVLHDSVKDTYVELVSLLEVLEKKTQEEMHTYGAQQVDTAYACRETMSILDNLRKRINRVYTVAQTVASVTMTAMGQDKLSTLHATATPKPRLWFKLVTNRESDPKEHDRLQTFLGVPQDIAEKEVVRIHGPNFCDYMTELVGEGKEVPVDVKNVRGTELNIRITKKKDI